MVFIKVKLSWIEFMKKESSHQSPGDSKELPQASKRCVNLKV